MNDHITFKVRCRALIVHEGKLLVVKHRPDADYYALPGGHMESGETALECFKREIKEELGVEPSEGRLLYVYTFKDRYGSESLELYFEVMNGKDFVSIEGLDRTHAYELAEIRWMNPAEDINLLPHIVSEDFKNGSLLSGGVRYIKG